MDLKLLSCRLGVEILSINSMTTLTTSKSTDYQIIFSLFLFTWLSYGVMISRQNVEAYYFLHQGASVVGSHGTFSVNGPGPDTFQYKGRFFENKQPGLFAISGVAYYCLKVLGLSYESNYVETGAWVTWLASSIFGAGCVTLVFIISWKLIGISLNSAMIGVLFFAFGTTYGSYATILHHDVIAGFFIVLSIYLAFSATEGEDEKFKSFSSAFLACLALSVSMLYSWTCGLLVLSILIKFWRQSALVLIGSFMGLASWFLYNNSYFDSPFITAMQASNDPVTLAPWGFMNIWNYFQQFFLLGELSILKYCPILYVCIIGLFLKKDPIVKILLGLAVLHVGLLMLMPFAYWYQQCQYGPRYLMPFMCYVACGLGIVIDSLMKEKRWFILFTVICIGLFSVFVNITGAVYGTMNCGAGYALFKYYASGVVSYDNIRLPLLRLLLGPLIVSALFLFYSYRKQNRLNLV